jgi:phycoerythrin-associated linker protein
MADTMELWANASTEDVQTVIRTVYKQVLGNAHVMDSERLTTAESQLCDGSITVRDFVRMVGKSEFYRKRHFEKCAPNRFVELNFMHFLGRPPETQAEISEHIQRCINEGYDAEIDSYIDSDEYAATFGENQVPFNRGARTESGLRQNTYNKMFALDRGPAQLSGAVKSSQMVGLTTSNKITASSATVIGSGTEKKFRIVVKGSVGGVRRVSTTEYLVTAEKMSPTLQRINRTSGKIVSITEIG